MNLNHQPKK